MSDSDFDRATGFVFRWEGGYVNDPEDPGGETKYGISKRAYPSLDIKDLTREKAAGIYRADYWLPAGCDELPWPWNMVAFDTAVNMGLRRARELKAQGGDWKDYLIRRIGLYAKFKGFNRFGRGWINRVVDLHRVALEEEHPLSEEER